MLEVGDDTRTGGTDKVEERQRGRLIVTRLTEYLQKIR